MKMMEKRFKQFESAKAKEFYLKMHYPYEEVPKMTDRMVCLCCGYKFSVQDFRVEITSCDCCSEYLEVITCPKAPDCDGLVTDWIGIETLN